MKFHCCKITQKTVHPSHTSRGPLSPKMSPDPQYRGTHQQVNRSWNVVFVPGQLILIVFLAQRITRPSTAVRTATGSLQFLRGFLGNLVTLSIKHLHEKPAGGPVWNLGSVSSRWFRWSLRRHAFHTGSVSTYQRCRRAWQTSHVALRFNDLAFNSQFVSVPKLLELFTSL